MNKEEILETIKMLSKSQGFYGRLLANITDEALEYLEKQDFEDALDLVMFLET